MTSLWCVACLLLSVVTLPVSCVASSASGSGEDCKYIISARSGTNSLVSYISLYTSSWCTELCSMSNNALDDHSSLHTITMIH